MRYVSIRHGGTQLALNEINGLTLGGVGSGTTLDHIEVVSNLDDNRVLRRHRIHHQRCGGLRWRRQL